MRFAPVAFAGGVASVIRFELVAIEVGKTWTGLSALEAVAGSEIIRTEERGELDKSPWEWASSHRSPLLEYGMPRSESNEDTVDIGNLGIQTEFSDLKSNVTQRMKVRICMCKN